MSTKLKPRVVQSVFSPDTFAKVQEHMDELARQFEGQPYPDADYPEDKRCNRHRSHNDPFHQLLHTFLEPVVSDLLGRPVKKSYVFAALYGDGGRLPAHTDRPQCKYTRDLCVSQSAPWGLFVDDEEYLLGEGEAVLYSGTDSPHYRNPIEPGNYCRLIFFHFVDPDFEGALE